MLPKNLTLGKRRGSSSVVGLDIEPGYLAAAEARVNGSVAVNRAVVSPLEPGLIRDGEVVEPDGLATALKSFFAEHGLSKRVRLGVANQRIVVRTMDLPPIEDRKQLEAAVRFQANDEIPMPLEQAVIDFHTLGLVQTEAGNRMRVVVVAARRDMIDRLLGAVRSAGLRPEGLDLSAFAMVRAVGAVSPPAEDEQEATAGLYVHVGGLTNVAVADGSNCRFTRVVVGGLEGLVAQLAERRSLTLEHSRQWLNHVGLLAPVEEIEGDTDVVSEARTVLADGVRRIADEVRGSLDYYRAQPTAVPVQSVVLTGPALVVPGFLEQFGADLGMDVRAGTVGEAQPGAAGSADLNHVTIAAGLAVSEGPQ